MSKLAILGGSKVIKNPLPAYKSINKKEKQLVMEVMDSGLISEFYGNWGDNFLGGKFVRKFEDKLCEILNCKHAISVNSNSSGLDMAIGAIGLSPGEEVITSPWSMSATSMAILRWGGIPRFVDIEDKTFTINPRNVEQVINKKTKAILVTNLFGHPSHLKELKKIADKYNLYLIEDNAQAPLAKEFGYNCGTIGHIGVLSFNYHKHIHTGEGGACVTNDSNLSLRMQCLRNHAEAIVDDANIRDLTNMIGSNFRMTELQAAIGIAQLEKIEEHISKRQEIAEFLNEVVKEFDGIKAPITRNKCTHVYYCWGAQINQNKIKISRELFSKALHHEGFPHGIGYLKPLYMLPIFQKKIGMGKKGFPFNLNKKINYKEGMCPTVEHLHHKSFFLFEPCAFQIKTKEKKLIKEVFNKIFDNINLLKKNEPLL